MRRFGLFFAVVFAAAAGHVGDSATLSASTPVIIEPAHDGQLISAYDVHMVAAPFSGAPGESHVCSDWEIRTISPDAVVWSAPCVTGTLKVHIHLGDGTFANALAGHHQLDYATDYKVRVRFLGDAPPPGSSWSDWAERLFKTFPATGFQPMVLSDVSPIPAVRWKDSLGQDVILPGGSSPAVLSLWVVGSTESLLDLTGTGGGANAVSNPPPGPAHGALRILLVAGTAPVSIPESVLNFTDGSGQDREIALPAASLAAGQTYAWWIAEGGVSFWDPTFGAPGAPPDFSVPGGEPAVPWAVRQSGFRVDRVATGFQLPVNVVFVPNPGSDPDDPFYYVTELYGNVQVVSRSGALSQYATGLLDFDPLGSFPGSGEKGVTGIAVDPGSRDVFVGTLFAGPDPNYHFPKVVRLHSTDGGHTAATQATIAQFPNEPLGPSHQISSVSIGPDGRLYVHIGDGGLFPPSQDLTSVRGKILRMELDGSPSATNPFYDAADGLTAKDYVFAYGLRNPFGGAWRDADGSHWEVENGPSVDRMAKIVAGQNYLWDGTDASMQNFAVYNWFPAHSPVNIAFVQPSAFSGSGFPAEKLDHAFVTESGPTYAGGPQALGKRVVEFVLDAAGNLVSGPLPLVEYVGSGRGTATALAAGPDGLYFADLYKDAGAATPTDRGASVFRIRWAGIADFTADATAGVAPFAVAFHDASNVPGASAWHWEFGDGAESNEHEPTHVYREAGVYDVRLTVTGSGGDAPRQKAAFVSVTDSGRGTAVEGDAARPSTRSLPPRS